MISVVPFYHTLWHHLWYDYLYIGAAVVVVTGMALLLVYGVSCFKGRYYS